MGIFQKLFGSKRPILKKTDIPSFEKVAEFVAWFMKNDSHVRTISNPSSNIIFNEGYRPKSGTENSPESINPNINSLAEWFITKIFVDLNMVKDASKDEFKQFIDLLDKASTETLITAGQIATKYDFNAARFVYEKEIEKIPAGEEREHFKVNFLQDNVLSAEIRILAWLYHEYFGEWYQLKEDRSE